ncbi:variable surface protein [Plasmodium gonderi]|uniref:Variable surface protein n=1 Tax=Plasmodium gonderi TaxID=77519 RepID=A0A1Y1JWE5_PLAGO|nr:variable surface protein [Plasmodium gonderi]GAW84663.1 variable surface protein [Plasmodium gonderi]
MRKSIYEIVVYFPQCKLVLDEKPKEITDYTHPGKWAKICIANTHNTKLSHLNVHNRNPQDICNQVMEYLAYVNASTKESLNEFGCEYLYYWIYELLHHKDNIDITVQVDEVYDELLNIFIKGYKDLRFEGDIKILRCLKNGIKEIDFPKIRAIYDMYNKIITHTYRNVDNFKDVVDMMNKHNKKMETLNGEISKSPITIPCKSNIAAHIIITLLVTLLICIFIFVLLKVKYHIICMYFCYFSECGLWIRSVIPWRRKLWDNKDDEKNIYHDPQISSSMLRDCRYNISYNYQ